ncbi:hypothetical protein J1605_012123 [Eschrichtius robustus]|uniref:Uncharacterized protein n=1 Tax=Eschrichtius robustus TaxID=9764 RepID=A0AB34GK40_ESCRO|nr:hypothetical protein J1605_012123 [Eschrichtius robustus]
MCEGPSRISGPIPPDPMLCPDYYWRPASAQGHLEGNALKLGLLTPDPDLDATPPRGTRIGPGAGEILERGRRGVGGVLLQLGGISLGPGASPKRKDPKDHEKENLRRIREIQRRFREQEHSRDARTAKRAPRRHSRSLQVLAQVLEQQRQAQEHYNATQKGHVPHHLLERRDLWRQEAEARQHSQPDPAVPPGHTWMPENQRHQIGVVSLPKDMLKF